MPFLARILRRRQAGRAQTALDASKDPAAVLAAVAATALCVGALGYHYHRPNDRSLLVEARSQQVRIPFALETTWGLPDAAICRERPPARSGTPPPVSPACGSDRALAFAPRTVSWQDGAEVTVRRTGHDAPQIVIVRALGSVARDGDAAMPLKDGDRLVLTGEAPRFGPLLFAGAARVGASGPDAPILLGGDYVWRETFLFRARPEYVGTEALRSGDILRVGSGGCDGQAQRVAGMVYSAPRDEPGLNVVLSAADEDQRRDDPLGLCLTRFGASETFVEPRWSARILADPMTYALGVLLTLALTVFPAALGLWGLLARPAEPAPAEDGPGRGAGAAPRAERAGPGSKARRPAAKPGAKKSRAPPRR